MTYLYQWANPDRVHEMPTPDELTAIGFMPHGADPRYPKTILMRKPITDQSENNQGAED